MVSVLNPENPNLDRRVRTPALPAMPVESWTPTVLRIGHAKGNSFRFSMLKTGQRVVNAH